MSNQESLMYRADVNEVMGCINQIFKALRVSSSQLEKNLGLSAAQIIVLKMLKKEPGLSINDLASRTTTHQSSVSVVVKKLEEQELVRREISKQDSRRVVVSLTEKGQLRLAEIPVMIHEQMTECLQKMPADKTQTLAQLMKEFVKEVGILSA